MGACVSHMGHRVHSPVLARLQPAQHHTLNTSRSQSGAGLWAVLVVYSRKCASRAFVLSAYRRVPEMLREPAHVGMMGLMLVVVVCLSLWSGPTLVSRVALSRC